jgi:hypothetical protein
MIRVGTLFSTILPSVLAGGVLFGSAPGHAEIGRDGASAAWSVAPDVATGPVVAQADPRPRPRYWAPPAPPIPPVPPAPGAYPAPPAPGAYPAPPAPPMPPGSHGHGRSRSRGHGMSISIHDGKIEIDGIAELVQEQLERVTDALDNLSDVPPDVRERVKARIRSVRDKLGNRLSKIKSLDLDKIGPEVERMGDEIEKDMEGLDNDLQQLGGKLGKHFAEKFGKDFAKSFGPGHFAIPGGHDSDNSDDADDDNDDDDDKAAVVMPPNVDTDMVDPSDVRAAIADVRNVALDQSQREQLAKLRAESERRVTEAKRELEAMSDRLHETLGDLSASEDDITRQIDLISQKEATIRKARILAWIKVRNLLDKDQRKQIEAAAKKGH